MSLMSSVGLSGSGSGSSLDSVVVQVQALLTVLDSLTLAVGQGVERLAMQSIQSEIVQLQPLFQSLLQALASAELAPVDRQRIRPFQTEAHRRLRLLGVTAMQLRSAKQPERLATVRSQLQDHLIQLRSFIQGIAAVLEAGAGVACAQPPGAGTLGNGVLEDGE